MKIKFVNSDDCFEVENPNDISYLYFPIANGGGVMASIAPNLAGDSKIGQNHFLLEPVSAEGLHSGMMGRNIWCILDGKKVWSAAGVSAGQQVQKYTEEKDQVLLRAGKLWHEIERKNEHHGIKASVLSFCPPTDERAEVMKVTFMNIGTRFIHLTPVFAIPIYGRSADNLRDHRHVTALLQRIYVEEEGVAVKPTLSFDERGHTKNEMTYGIYARGDGGERPEGFYPLLGEFIGEGGSLNWPRAIVCDDVPLYHAGDTISGYEAMGGIRFKEIRLSPGEAKTYYAILSYNREGMAYLEENASKQVWENLKNHWSNVSAISCYTKDENFNHWMGWVGIQPELRRIFGCSFLPHHDYGKGGRGWRDLWQDSLSLLLKDPKKVRSILIRYFDGVRIDGSNATIIGTVPGEFIADRNAIVRVWMDHGLWPLITIKQYLDMTGDFTILLEEGTYFKDSVCCRGDARDEVWDGIIKTLCKKDGNVMKATVLERILVQHLTAFFDVGEHGYMRLRGADWNDALDLAGENGESVAFTAAYSGNFHILAELMGQMQRENHSEIEVGEELVALIRSSAGLDGNWAKMQKVLWEYNKQCRHCVSGKKVQISLAELEKNFNQKADWIQNHIRKEEWIGDHLGNHWFNSYYDDHKNRVEGVFESGVRMMLTGQVFAILSGTATNEQTAKICEAADTWLYEEALGGYRLNTNFSELKMDLGRMFGFAYGHKENGAVFSHMAVMYAYSLYSRGFAKEGYKAIHTLYRQAVNTEKSLIYPGIPEYFDVRGRGMYHYLTGAASWMVLTVLTQMFGIKGKYGDLLLRPQLLLEQFDEKGIAAIECSFAGRTLEVIYVNKEKKELNDYEIEELYMDEREIPIEGEACISRERIIQMDPDKKHEIRVVLR